VLAHGWQTITESAWADKLFGFTVWVTTGTTRREMTTPFLIPCSVQPMFSDPNIFDASVYYMMKSRGPRTELGETPQDKV